MGRKYSVLMYSSKLLVLGLLKVIGHVFILVLIFYISELSQYILGKLNLFAAIK